MDTDELDGYLRQAACPEDVRAHIEQLARSGHVDEGLLSLAEYRVQLLGELHTVDHRLFCLDRVIDDIKATL